MSVRKQSALCFLPVGYRTCHAGKMLVATTIYLLLGGLAVHAWQHPEIEGLGDGWMSGQVQSFLFVFFVLAAVQSVGNHRLMQPLKSVVYLALGMGRRYTWRNEWAVYPGDTRRIAQGRVASDLLLLFVFSLVLYILLALWGAFG